MSKAQSKNPTGLWERRPSGDNVLRKGLDASTLPGTPADVAGVQVEGRPALTLNPWAGVGGGRVASSEFQRGKEHAVDAPRKDSPCRGGSCFFPAAPRRAVGSSE